MPDTQGYPIFDIGLEIETHDSLGVDGTLYLDYLHWDGAPDITLRRPDTTQHDVEARLGQQCQPVPDALGRPARHQQRRASASSRKARATGRTTRSPRR